MPIDFSNGITIGGIKCYDQGTVEDFNNFDTSATRKIACKWSDRKTLINALNPQGTQLGGTYIMSTSPYPDFPYLYPQRFRVRNAEGSQITQSLTGQVSYDYAVIDVEYRPFRGGDPQGWIEFDLGANVITMPGSGTWLETDVPAGQTPVDVPIQDCARGYPLALIGICRGRSFVNRLDTELISQCAIKPLNDRPFLNFPAGTVMFQGARARRQTATSNGLGTSPTQAGPLNGVWEVEYRFQCRPALPWDYLPFRKKVDNAFQFVLEKVRLKHGAGPYIGRSNLDALFAN